MSNFTAGVKMLNLKDILPDENQPRKYFAADKLKLLESSIKQHGVMTPLVVEDMGNGKFLLIDGERRFRASTNAGVKEVPAVIEQPKKHTERLIRQFNIQEQHEGWTPTEKAMAISAIAEEMGLTLPNMCDLLNVSPKDRGRYIAFAGIIDKEAFVRSEIPLDYAAAFRTISLQSRRITERTLEKEWNNSTERKLEKGLIKLISSGDVKKPTDLTSVRDSFLKKPELIERFINEGGISPSKMFAESKARGAYHLRNAISNAQFFMSNANHYLKVKDVPLTPENIAVFKHTIKVAQKLIDIVE